MTAPPKYRPMFEASSIWEMDTNAILCLRLIWSSKPLAAYNMVL